jgi:hypothetical protein
MEIDKEIDGWVKQTIMEREDLYKAGDIVMVKGIENRLEITKTPLKGNEFFTGVSSFSSVEVSFPLENILCSAEEIKYEIYDRVLVEGVDSDVIIASVPSSDIDYYEGTKSNNRSGNRIMFYREAILGHALEENYMTEATRKRCDEHFMSLTPERYSSRNVNGMDVIDLVKHWGLNFNEGNILKYLIRDKGQDVEDLQKIINYAKRELEYRNK